MCTQAFYDCEMKFDDFLLLEAAREMIYGRFSKVHITWKNCKKCGLKFSKNSRNLQKFPATILHLSARKNRLVIDLVIDIMIDGV